MLQGNSLNHRGYFYSLNCFSSYTKKFKEKIKEHEETCNNHDSCHIEMPKWVEKILKCNPGEKSLKAPFAIYLDLECLLKKEQFHQNNNVEEPYTEKNAKYEPSGWALFKKCSFDEKENKLDYCTRNNCIKKLCKKLKRHAMKINNHEKKRNDATNL